MEQVSKKWSICIVWVGREDMEHEESYSSVPDSSSGHVKATSSHPFLYSEHKQIGNILFTSVYFFVISILCIYFLILSCEM
jgi:hypothetical protein